MSLTARIEQISHANNCNGDGAVKNRDSIESPTRRRAGKVTPTRYESYKGLA
jgi:hypothetical protein